MKTKIVIYESNATIELIPENSFEIDLIDRLIDEKYVIETSVSHDYNFGVYSKQRIELSIKKNEKSITNLK